MQRRSAQRTTPRRRLPWRTIMVPVASAAAMTMLPPLAAQASTQAGTQAGPTSPPPVTILTAGADNGDGDIFIAPFGDTGSYANGPEILSPSGRVIWFHAVPAGQEAADFRVQDYQGRPVLTWWQGTGLGGLSSGTDYIYNARYQQVATVSAGNGYSADGHEFLITPQGTALILAYTTATADLTAIGGPPDQTVIDGIVQEIDIRTGQVLFQWDSADHVPYADSEQPLPASAATPWDWFHINAVHLDTDGNLLIDARDTWTTDKVNRHTGAIAWELGGKQSSFRLRAAPGQVLDSAGEIFAWQHDPEALGHGRYTFFDNESSGTPLLPYSRAVTVRLNLRDRVATLVASDAQPERLSAASQGNVQTTRNGDLFIGWGALPYFSEFSPSGQPEFNAEFPAGVNTYRAYRLPWPSPAPSGASG
ncbi:MAG: arylsulfotransferase family protein [Streptosporangiales bacterium]